MSDDLVPVESEGIRLGLDERGCLFSFRAPSLLREWAVMQTEPRFCWDMYLDHQPARAAWQFHHQEMIEAGAVFQGEIDGCVVEITVTIDHLGPNWQVKLTNRNEKRVITLFEYRLEVPFDLREALHCTIPYCAGWTLPLSSLQDGDAYTLAYPAKASMQWVDLYTRSSGVYFGVHDPLPYYKKLELKQVAGRARLCWQFPDLDLQPGEMLALPPVYLVPHQGCWHVGAAIYREWAQQHVIIPKTPDWYRRNPSWAWVGMRGQHEAEIWHQAADLPRFSEEVAACNVNLVQLTAYNELGQDKLYPDYSPGPSMGGEKGLRQAVNAIHQDKRYISIYTNGRIVDPASSLTEEQRQAWGVKIAPQASVFQETYGSVTFDVMCPGSPGWRNLFIRRLVYLVQRLNLDGVYVDQVSAAPSLPCYSSGHDHAKPNQAWSFYRQLLADLRQALKTINPNLFLATEGVNDLLGQYFDSQQAHQDWPAPFDGKAQRLNDLYRFTFPGHLLNSGCVTQEVSGCFYLKVGHLTGSGFDFGVWDWSELPPDFCEAIRFAVGWRQVHTEVLQSPPFTIESGMIGIHTLGFLGNNEMIINMAWLPEASDEIPEDEVRLNVPIPAGRFVQQVHCEQPGSKSQVFWSIEENHLQICLPFTEMAGIRIEWGAGR